VGLTPRPAEKWIAVGYPTYLFQTEEGIMSRMAKHRGEPSPRNGAVHARSRRRRAVAADSNRDFVRAFADALRDILRHERRHAA
jgi:hypothetical protein